GRGALRPQIQPTGSPLNVSRVSCGLPQQLDADIFAPHQATMVRLAAREPHPIVMRHRPTDNPTVASVEPGKRRTATQSLRVTLAILLGPHARACPKYHSGCRSVSDRTAYKEPCQRRNGPTAPRNRG